jgi:hypothetical protein
VIEAIKKYNEKEKLKIMFGTGYWHWLCILLALFCQAEKDDNRAMEFAKKMFDIYEITGITEITKHKFGRQNYNENLTNVSKRLNIKINEILPSDLPEKFELIPNVSYSISDVQMSVDKICNDVHVIL